MTLYLVDLEQPRKQKDDPAISLSKAGRVVPTSSRGTCGGPHVCLYFEDDNLSVAEGDQLA